MVEGEGIMHVNKHTTKQKCSKVIQLY